MCLYPKKYINRKYTVTEKNGGCVPMPPIIGKDQFGHNIYDERVLYINIPCGQCIECRKSKARAWQVRLHEELDQWEYKYFITLTFSPEQLGILRKEIGKGDVDTNAALGLAIRRSLERYRKDHKKSLRHWYISELGHEGTERIHSHGIIFSNEPLEFTKSKEENFYHWKYWKYGLVYVGTYCNHQTINYIVKYMLKIDDDHKGYVGQVFCSPGIGKAYIEKPNTQITHKYRPRHTNDFYRLQNGTKVKLPTYYKNKLLNEEERERMWREFMDMDKVTVMGNDHSTTDNRTLGNIVAKAQEINRFLEYGDDSKEWRKRTYNITQRMINSEKTKKIVKNDNENLVVSK